jgi:hypothetical protein
MSMHKLNVLLDLCVSSFSISVTISLNLSVTALNYARVRNGLIRLKNLYLVRFHCTMTFWYLMFVKKIEDDVIDFPLYLW